MCAGRYKKTADAYIFYMSYLANKATVSASQEKEGNKEEKKKISFSFKRIPPSEILFRCTLHFVALMQALNCFGTCHKN